MAAASGRTGGRRRARAAAVQAAAATAGRAAAVGAALALAAAVGLALAEGRGGGRERALAAPARGHVGALLHAQALSHLAFHSDAVKVRLARLFPAFGAAAVVGVEWGGEAFALAARGYRVYAIEPARAFAEHVRRTAAAHARWNVTVAQVAAGNASRGTTVVAYDNAGVRETAALMRVDDVVRGDALGVLSADIQGDELHVVQGARRLLAGAARAPRGGAASLWVEAIACNAKVLRLLRLLDAHYAAFDFVPWGLPADAPRAAAPPAALRSYALHRARPAPHHRYVRWLCRRRAAAFRWLQTDLLFVRRDLLTPRVLARLRALHRLCRVARCQLRQLLRHS